MIFKLKRANPNAITRFAIFASPPSWKDLSTRISGLFDIPVRDILLVYIDNTPTALANDEELQNFYQKIQTDKEINFVVQDKENMDGSHLSDLSNDDKLSLNCMDLSSPNPLLVEIEACATVSKLKERIKEEMEYGCPHDALNLFQLSPPIPSSELELRLLHVQGPKDIKGCILLDPLDKLSEYFSWPPRKHVHIIVEHPPTG